MKDKVTVVKEGVVKIQLDKVQMKKLMELRFGDHKGLLNILRDSGIIKPHKKESK